MERSLSAFCLIAVLRAAQKLMRKHGPQIAHTLADAAVRDQKLSRVRSGTVPATEA